MKVSCLPVSLFPALSGGQMSLADWCGAAKECGLDGIDISMSFLSSHAPAYLDGVKDALEKAGAQVVMATAYPDFTHPQKRQREREMAYFVRDIALCSELGIPYLRVLAGQAHPETAVRDGVRWAIENIRNASNVADRYGVQLLYEDHSKPGAWKHADFSYPPDIFLEIADGIWDTSAGINFDTANIAAYGQDPLPILEKVLPKVETVHVSDIKEYGSFSPVAIGTGAVPLRAIFQYLKRNGFDKWLCIEEASFQGIRGIAEAARTVRRMWDEIKIES
jgi:sugar phosphate isomerase/epimerase